MIVESDVFLKKVLCVLCHKQVISPGYKLMYNSSAMHVLLTLFLSKGLETNCTVIAIYSEMPLLLVLFLLFCAFNLK